MPDEASEGPVLLDLSLLLLPICPSAVKPLGYHVTFDPRLISDYTWVMV